MGQRAVRLGLLVTLVVVTAACDWTTVGFDASRSGFNAPDTTISTANVALLTQKWKAALPTGSGSEPVAAGGRVFISALATASATTGALQSFDARGITSCTGAAPAICQPLWSVSYPPVMSATSGINLSAPTVSGANVLIGLESLVPLPALAGSAIQLYSASTGASAFSTGPGGSASPSVTGGHIYGSVVEVARRIPFIAIRYLAAFDAATGVKQFIATDADASEYTSAPAIANGVLFAIAGTRLAAFDANGVTNCGTNAPPQWAGTIVAPKYCQPLWSATLADSSTGLAVANGSVYVTNSLGRLAAFPATGCGAPTCPATWTATAGTQSLTAPAVTGKSVFVGSKDGHLYAFPARGCGAATCASSWTASVGAAVSAPSVAGSVVFVGSNDGRLRAFNAGGCGTSTCAAAWNTNVGTPVATAPTVVDGRVFVTDTAGTLHAYGL